MEEQRAIREGTRFEQYDRLVAKALSSVYNNPAGLIYAQLADTEARFLIAEEHARIAALDRNE